MTQSADAEWVWNGGWGDDNPPDGKTTKQSADDGWVWRGGWGDDNPKFIVEDGDKSIGEKIYHPANIDPYTGLTHEEEMNNKDTANNDSSGFDADYQ